MASYTQVFTTILVKGFITRFLKVFVFIYLFVKFVKYIYCRKCQHLGSIVMVSEVTSTGR